MEAGERTQLTFTHTPPLTPLRDGFETIFCGKVQVEGPISSHQEAEGNRQRDTLYTISSRQKPIFRLYNDACDDQNGLGCFEVWGSALNLRTEEYFPSTKGRHLRR